MGFVEDISKGSLTSDNSLLREVKEGNCQVRPDAERRPSSVFWTGTWSQSAELVERWGTMPGHPAVCAHPHG